MSIKNERLKEEGNRMQLEGVLHLDERERAVFVRMVEWFTEPGPYTPDCLSVKDMARSATYSGSALYGMDERQIRNACRRLKRKGLIGHAWQKENPDQPSGEYGEVWDGSPFIPRHGYGITQAGWNTTLAQETAKRVKDEFVHYWASKLREGETDAEGGTCHA